MANAPASKTPKEPKSKIIRFRLSESQLKELEDSAKSIPNGGKPPSLSAEISRRLFEKKKPQ